MEVFDRDLVYEALGFFTEVENRLRREGVNLSVDLKAYSREHIEDLERYIRLIQTMVDSSPGITSADYLFSTKVVVLPHYRQTSEFKVNTKTLSRLVNGIIKYYNKQIEPDCSPGTLDRKISDWIIS